MIFWAYAGFEISTIPADDIDKPSKTIPKAVVFGILIVTVFYLTTNVVLFAVRNSLIVSHRHRAFSFSLKRHPNFKRRFSPHRRSFGWGWRFNLCCGFRRIGNDWHLKTWLCIATDGLFPKVFAKVHKKFKTPYASIIIQSVTALVASIVGGLSLLISVSVFFLAIAYLATSASVFPLRKKNPTPNVIYGKKNMVLPVLGIIFSVFLISQCTLSQILIGVLLLSVGVPIYIKYSPKQELSEAKQALLYSQNVFRRVYRQEHVFLAHLLHHLRRWYRKMRGKPADTAIP